MITIGIVILLLGVIAWQWRKIHKLNRKVYWLNEELQYTLDERNNAIAAYDQAESDYIVLWNQYTSLRDDLRNRLA